MANPAIKFHSFCGNANECVSSLAGADGLYNGFSFGTGYYKNSQGSLTVPAASGGGTNYWKFTGNTFEPEGCIEMWVKPNGWNISGSTVSDGRTHRIFNFNQGSDAAGLLLSVLSGFGFYVYMKDTSGSGPTLIVGSSSLPSNTWTHLAVSWSVANNRLKLYKNGAEIGTSTPSPAIAISGLTTMETWVGSRSGDSPAANSGFNGDFDGAIYSNRYRTSFMYRNNKRRYLNDYGSF